LLIKTKSWPQASSSKAKSSTRHEWKHKITRGASSMYTDIEELVYSKRELAAGQLSKE